MKKRFFMFSACAAVLYLMGGCASTSKKEQTVNGVVYDGDNQCLSDVGIFIDGKKISETDTYGHFYFNRALLKQKSLFTVQKSGYEKIEICGSEEISSFLYLTMFSCSSLIEKSMNALLSGNISEAEVFLNKAAKADSEKKQDKSIVMLECLILYRQKRYEECIKRLDEACNKYGDESFVKFREKLNEER